MVLVYETGCLNCGGSMESQLSSLGECVACQKKAVAKTEPQGRRPKQIKLPLPEEAEMAAD